MTPEWNTSNRKEFHDYYVDQHSRADTRDRFRNQRDAILALYRSKGGVEPRDILDVGCNAGAFSRTWAEKGFRVTGIDIGESLVHAAREAAKAQGYEIDYRVGSATELPYPDQSFDIVCMPELLEHVEDWQSCLDESTRVLRRGGVLALSTTNVLCPKQLEFNLPGYSWYPAFFKRRFERLAVTTRPELANHASYPAVNWFSFYGLRRYLGKHGMVSFDRFDIAALTKTDGPERAILWLIRNVPGLRLLGLICTPGTSLMARKT